MNAADPLSPPRCRPGPLAFTEVQEHFAAAGVAKFKWPERLETVEDLPRTKVGKVDKAGLREHVRAMVSGSEDVDSTTP